jgi:hypothetical protein
MWGEVGESEGENKKGWRAGWLGGGGRSRVIKFLNAPERPEQGD